MRRSALDTSLAQANVRIMVTQQFLVGQLIQHTRFGYRGVIVDVDCTFQLSDEWYNHVARSRPPKDEPWYRVLVDDSDKETYVAQRNLEHDIEGSRINHPRINQFFDAFCGDHYARQRNLN